MKDSRAVSAIIEELKNLYPDASCSLDFDPDKAYELLFSVRLAAQCTDARVNLVTPILYAKYPTLEALAAATEEEVGEIIHSTGFWRAKARDIVAASRMLVEEYGGRVPDTMEDLLRLPGVGRKTANLILGDVYGQEGYVCDTHCIRITGLLQRLLPPDGPPRPCGVRGPPSRLRQLHPPPLVRPLEWPAGGTGGDAGRYLPGCTQIGEALPAGEPLPELPCLYGVPASGLLRRHFTITR